MAKQSVRAASALCYPTFNSKSMLVAVLEALVEQIDTLTRKLPNNVPIAARESHISRSLTLPGEDGKAASTFNRRMDVLFGEDVRDAAGRLKYVAAGKYGMHAVVKYLKTVPWAELEYTIVQPKLDRIIRSASLPSPPATQRISQKLSAFEAVRVFRSLLSVFLFSIFSLQPQMVP
ncbi:hypothetical protein K438DRAFT_568969 [Mycena galopus ATCC 62051]|nr:hypothetical protein K438DRAFT_568969 [Mycena galopus ATCC 62051]